MKTKLFYTAPQAESMEIRVELSFAQSFNTTERTEKMVWDDDEIDL